MRATATQRRWADLVRRHDASGLSGRAFARANGINANSLAWWRSKLRKQQDADHFAGFTELAVIPDAQDRAASDDCVVVVALDVFPARILVRPDSDLQLLRRMLEALC